MAVEFDFSRLESSIQRAVGALEALEKRLQKTANSQTAFNKLFGNTAQFDHFVDSVNKLGAVGAANFKLVADGLTQLANSLNALKPGASALPAFTRNMVALVDALNNLKTTKASQQRLQTFIDSFVVNIQKLTTGFSSIPNVENITRPLQSLTRSINGLIKLFSGIGNVSNVSTLAISAIHGMVAGLISIANDVNASSVQIEAVAKLLTSAARIVDQARRLTAMFSGLKAPPGGMNTAGGLMGYLAGALPDATRIAGLAASLELLKGFIGSLGSVANGIGNVDRVVKLAAALRSLQQTIAFIFSAKFLPQNAEDLTSRIAAAISALKQVEFLAQGVSKIAVNLRGVRDVSSLGAALKNIASALKIIDQFSANISSDKLTTDISAQLRTRLSGIVTISQGLKPIFDQLVSVATANVVQRIQNFFGISKISIVLREIGYIANELAKIAAGIPNLDTLGQLGNAMRNLAQGIKIIAATAENIPTGITERIKRFLGIGNVPEVIRMIGYTAKQLAGVAKGIPNLEGLGQLGRSLSGIADFIKALNNTRIPDLKTNFFSGLINKLTLGLAGGGGKLKNFTYVIKELAKAFKGFKNIAVPDFGTVLPALMSFATDPDISKFKSADLSGFSRFTKELASGINHLAGIKIGNDKLAAIGSVLNGLSKTGGFSVTSVQNSVKQAVAGVSSPSFLNRVLQGAASNLVSQAVVSAVNKVKNFLGSFVNIDLKIAKHLQNMGRNLDMFGIRVGYLGQRMLQSFGLEALVRNPLVQLASDFDHLSNAVQTFGHLTDAETERASRYADELGIKYPFSANEALQATLDLIKAGQDLNSVEFILPNAADLAALGDTDLPTTTKALIEATNAFDFYAEGVAATFDNVAVAANSFSGAADISTAVLTELIDGMQNVAPAANLAGLNLQDTLAILVQFNNAGVRGAEAGTQLRSVLNSLVSNRAKDELAALQLLLEGAGKDISLSLADSAGNLRNLDDFVKSLAATYQGLGFTQEQVLDSISKISDTYGRRGLAILLKNAGFGQIIDQINQMDSASVRATQLLDDFRGETQQLTGSLETLYKNAFLPLIENAFRPFVHFGRQIVDGILRIGQASPQIYEFAANVVLLGSALVTFTGAALIAIGITLRFEGVLVRLIGGFLWFSRHIPVVVAAIGSFIASGALLLLTLTAIAGAIAGTAAIIGGFRDVIVRNVGGAGDAFRRFQDAVAITISHIRPVLGQVGRVIKLIFGGTVQREIDGFGQRIAEFFDRLGLGSLDLNRTLLQIGALVENFGNFIEEAFGGATPQRIAFFEDQLRKLSNFPLIKAIFGQNATPAGLRKVFGDVLNTFTRLRDSVGDLLSGGIGILFGEKDAIKRVRRGAALFLSTITGLIQNMTGLDLSESILSFDEGRIGEGIGKLLGSVANRIRQWAAQNRNQIVDSITSVITFFNPLNGVAQTLRILGFENAANVVAGVNRAISDVLKRILNFAIDFIGGRIAIDTLPAQRLFEAIFGDLSGSAEKMAEVVRDLVLDAISKVPGLLQDIGTSLGIQPLIDLGISLSGSAAFEQFTTALSNIAAFPFDAASKTFTGIGDIFHALQTGNVLAVTGLLLALGGIGVRAGLLTTLFTTLKGLLLGVALPAFGIVTLVSALGNIKDLLEGDVGGFLSKTLADIASTLLSFFGVEMSRETILDQVTQAFQSMHDTLPALINAIGDQISKALGRLVDIVTLAFEGIRASADESLGFASSGFGAEFHRAQTFIQTTLPTKDLFSILGGAEIDDTALRALARVNSDKVLAAFQDAAATGFDKLSPVLLERMGRVLNVSGLLDEALSTLGSDEDRQALLDRLEQIFVLSNDQIDALRGSFARSLGRLEITNKEGAVTFFRNAFAALGIDKPTLQKQVLEQLKDSIPEGFGMELIRQVEEEISRAPLSGGFAGAIPLDSPLQITAKADVTVSAGEIDISPLMISTENALTRGLTNLQRFQRALLYGYSSGLSRNAGRALPTRASGGDLQPYSAYGVHDTPRPEVAMFNDGTSLLLTGRAAGRITKIIGMASAPVTDIQSLNDYINYQAQQGQSVDLATLTNEDIAAARKAIKEKAKAAKDYSKQINSINRDISDTELDTLQKAYQLQQKYYEDQRKAERDFNHDRQNILIEGRQSLLDAIRRGDGAAAQETVRNVKKSLDEQQYQYDNANEDRKIQLKESQRQNEEERKQRLADYAQRLQDLKDQQEEQAEEEQDAAEDRQIELEAANRTQAETQARANAEQARQLFARLYNYITAEGTITDIAQRATNKIVGIGEAFGIMIGRAFTLLSGAQQEIDWQGAIGSGSGQTLPIVPQSTGNPNPPPNTFTPVGAPARPGALQTYRDPSGVLWIWTGYSWQRATAVTGRATGGLTLPHSAYQIFDTPRDELMLTNDGRRLLLTGDNGGRIIPLPPNTNSSRSRDAGTQVINLSVDLGGISGVSDPAAAVELARQTLIPEIQRIVDRAASGNRSRTLLEVR